MNRVGFFGILVIVLLLAALAWTVTILVYVLGFAILFGGPIFAISKIVQAWQNVARRNDVEKMHQQIELIAQDCMNDLTKLSLRWHQVRTTMGIGTHLQEELENNPADAYEVDRLLDLAQKKLEHAPDSYHRIEAIKDAESTRRVIARFLEPTEGF